LLLPHMTSGMQNLQLSCRERVFFFMISVHTFLNCLFTPGWSSYPLEGPYLCFSPTPPAPLPSDKFDSIRVISLLPLFRKHLAPRRPLRPPLGNQACYYRIRLCVSCKSMTPPHLINVIIQEDSSLPLLDSPPGAPLLRLFPFCVIRCLRFPRVISRPDVLRRLSLLWSCFCITMSSHY